MTARQHIEDIVIEPYFHLELFMVLSQNKRLDAHSAATVSEYWERYREHLRVKRLDLGKKSYILTWLEAFVEEDINTAWEASPSKAFLLNSLAQTMLMAVIAELIPEIAASGCAPAPRPTKELREALVTVGVPWTGQTTLSRQYAMLTPYPFQGGCASCFLRKDCPKANMESS